MKITHPTSVNARRAVALATSLGTIALGVTTPAWASEEVSLYTTREPKLILPLLEQFTRESGVKVNTVFVKDGLLERVRTEGAQSPADVLMTVDAGNLLDLVEGGVTQPVKSQTLEDVIPANLRGADGQWFALSLRDRVLYVDRDLGLKSFTYEDLADPKYKGKVCIRSGQHPYNTALIAAMIAHDGAEKTQAWLQGVKSNLARKAAGGDRDVARDILGGICDIGLANAYYAGQMKNAAADTDARRWGDAITVVRPTFANARSGGTHVNITGAALAKNAPNKANGVKLLEYLVSEPAQVSYAQANYEYPVRKGVKLDPVVKSFGELKIDPLPITELVKNRKLASELVDKVGFDN